MPSMDPLVRQQGLLFEQSELLKEQFFRFGEGMQRLHGSLERLREDLDLERQQRVQGEEKNTSALMALCVEVNGERRKQEMMLKQVDERLISVREEVVLRAKAADGEMQRLGSRIDGLATDIGAQLMGLLEKQQVFGDALQAEMHSVVSEEHAWYETSLIAVRDELLQSLVGKTQLQEEVRQRGQALARLETRIDEECLVSLRAESSHWQASLEAGQTEREALKNSLTTVREVLETMRIGLSTESQHRGAGLESVNIRIDGNYDECLNVLREEECRRLAGEESLRLSVHESLASLNGRLSAAEGALTDRIAGMEAESACEAASWLERMAALNATQQHLGAEMGSERQQRSVNTVGLTTEVSEIRWELAREVESHHEAASSLSQCTQQTARLQQFVQEEESAQSALNEALSQQAHELQERTSELHMSLQTAVSDGLRGVTDSGKLGRDELWHVLGILQEHTLAATEEMQECRIRTKNVEEKTLGQFQGQLEEFASLNGEMVTKVESLEKCSLKEQVELTSRLDIYAYSHDQTREIVDGLASQIATRNFLEAPNSKFRLYLTPDGDLAVFQRNNWGKYADSDFQGVPCWHAGCQPGGDRPLCSVNREMQAHEKDRFLAIANRVSLPQ